MTIYRARWVLPISSPPVRDGAVATDGGVVFAAGPASSVLAGRPAAGVRDLGATILLPGLVNAHTHLSLTGLAGTVSPGAGFFDGLAQVARASASLSEASVRDAVREGIAECRRLGTAAVGEITTRPEGAAILREETGLAARVFFEFLGVTAERARERFAAALRAATAFDQAVPPPAGGARAGLSPHAPYSVWPEFWGETARASREHHWVWSTHLAEPPGEDAFLERGAGPLLAYLEGLGVWDGSFPLPGTGAVEMLEPALDRRALLVHAVHLDARAIARVAGSGASVCLCPRSNAYLGLPPAPALALHRAGVPLCLGTDSRATNHDLSVWAEMRALRKAAPEIPAAAVLEMATAGGARALGLADRAGSLRTGYAGPVLAIPAGALAGGDPAEYLTREPVEEAVRLLEP